MLQASPSLNLVKFLWSNSKQNSPASMTISAIDDTTPEPIRLIAHDSSLDNVDFSRNIEHGISGTSVIKFSNEEKEGAFKMIGLREFWNNQMKASEEKWKHYIEQMNADHEHRNVSYDMETGEIDWEAVRERIAWRWRLSQEKPDNMSKEEWQKLQEIGDKLRPLFIYKTCGLYSRLMLDPDNRPIFQEFDFF